MKLHFSFLWLLFLILSLFSHALKVYLIIFLMLFIHEMAHVLMALKLGYQVGVIHVYPFGFSAQIYHLDHGQVFEILLILFAGLGMHLLFFPLIEFTYRWDMISYGFRDYLMQINAAILLFNLLPLYPMDGGRIFLCILRFIFSYDFSRKVVLLFSLIFSILLFIIGMWNMKIIMLFLIFLLINEIRRNEEDLVEFSYRQRNHFKLDKNHV